MFCLTFAPVYKKFLLFLNFCFIIPFLVKSNECNKLFHVSSQFLQRFISFFQIFISVHIYKWICPIKYQSVYLKGKVSHNLEVKCALSFNQYSQGKVILPTSPHAPFLLLCQWWNVNAHPYTMPRDQNKNHLKFIIFWMFLFLTKLSLWLTLNDLPFALDTL